VQLSANDTMRSKRSSQDEALRGFDKEKERLRREIWLMYDQ
jgi:hypothetical protein